MCVFDLFLITGVEDSGSLSLLLPSIAAYEDESTVGGESFNSMDDGFTIFFGSYNVSFVLYLFSSDFRLVKFSNNDANEGFLIQFVRSYVPNSSRY